jgi:hypothetical protein
MFYVSRLLGCVGVGLTSRCFKTLLARGRLLYEPLQPADPPFIVWNDLFLIPSPDQHSPIDWLGYVGVKPRRVLVTYRLACMIELAHSS